MRSVHIDGSHGEGGGQVLRTSLSLAVLLGCELSMDSIRAGRSKPGLAAQHVTCLRAAAAICDAEIEGDEIGSQALRFRPGPVRPGEYCFDVADVRPSAGAVCLVLQTVLPPLLLAPERSEVTVRGGTNVPWSPCYEYIAGVFLPALSRLGLQAESARLRGGWYPRGGGEILTRIRGHAGPVAPFDLARRGDLQKLTITSTVSDRLPEHILGRQRDGALAALPEEISEVAETASDRPGGGPGTCLAIAAQFEAGHAGATALGERGKSAEKVGAEAAAEFREFLSSGAAVDSHLADQLLLYASLAKGESRILGEANTEHLRTNAWVIRQFIDADIALEGDRPVEIRARGVGFTFG